MPKEVEKKINLSDENIFSKETENKASKAVMGTEVSKSMAERIRNHEGGTWIMYNESLADRFGTLYTIDILPISYDFQKGFKTFVLDEHEKHIWNIFDRKIRTRGVKVTNNDNFRASDEKISEMEIG